MTVKALMIRRGLIDSSTIPEEARGATHRHYKGDWYKVLMEAVHTETSELLVIYELVCTANLGIPKKPQIYARPHQMFYGNTSVDENKEGECR